MKFREITEEDIPALVALLAEGFPRASADYWRNALAILAQRPRIGALPRYGYVADDDGALQGVMLMLASEHSGATFCNLSSWYMRPDHRKYAPMLFQRSLRFKDVNFTDCSPAPHVLPIVTKFGFRPYSGGTLLLDARQGLRRSPVVRPFDASRLDEIDPAIRPRIEAHLTYGCQALLIDGDGSHPTPLLYRTTRLKKFMPAARFVFGDPEVILAHAGALARMLMRRGALVMLVDWPQDRSAEIGWMLPTYGLRYVRGANAPMIGDLLDTEIGLFGL